VSHRALAPAALDALRGHVPAQARSDAPLRCLPELADPYFRLDVLAPRSGDPTRVEGGYAVLVVLDGAGELTWADGATTLVRGDVYAVPSALGDWQLHGDVRAVATRPGTEPADPGGRR
jgi:mannose-6-phosphate isomerase